VIDARANRVAASFLTATRPRAVAFSSRTPQVAFVTAEIGRSVSAIDTVHHRVTRTLPIGAAGSSPVGVAVSPDGRRVYVATGHGNSVVVIDAGRFVVSATIPVGQRPWGIAVTPDGSRLYSANGLSGDISVIDTSSNRVVATVEAGDGPWGVAVGR
jgi:YVTN family beta-propeller protein